MLADIVSDKWELILTLIYMIYNEYKRKQLNVETLNSDKLELSRSLAKEEQKETDKQVLISVNEIERYVVNKFKHYKLQLSNSFTTEVQLVQLAVDGILLDIILKVEKELMVHIKDNGYHELRTVELESYIQYISVEIYDIFFRHLIKYNDIINIQEYVILDDIEDIIRDIFETAIDISTRLQKDQVILDLL